MYGGNFGIYWKDGGRAGEEETSSECLKGQKKPAYDEKWRKWGGGGALLDRREKSDSRNFFLFLSLRWAP
jgi:hypothetical protein